MLKVSVESLGEVDLRVVTLRDTEEVKEIVLPRKMGDYRGPILALSSYTEGVNRTILYYNDIYLAMYIIKERNIVGCYISDVYKNYKQLEYGLTDKIDFDVLTEEVRGYRHSTVNTYLDAIISGDGLPYEFLKFLLIRIANGEMKLSDLNDIPVIGHIQIIESIING